MSSANIEDIYALAPMQQGILFHSLYAPRSGVYVEQLHCTLGGHLDEKAFTRAWQRVIERHPALRTAFVWEDLDEPVQVVFRNASLSLEIDDWRRLSQRQQSERLSTLLEADRSRGFELMQAPLMRLTLIRRSENSYHFLWSFHHLLLDGWSVPIVLKEAFTFYEAFCRGDDMDVACPPPYRDYIAWLRRQDLSVAESYWRRELKGFTVPTRLAVDRALHSSTTPTETFAEQNLHLSASATASLKILSRQHQLTLNTIAQGACALLLSRYSGEADVVFGTVVAGRPASLAKVESMVGLFVNTLPVRVTVCEKESALSWLKKLQAKQVELREYEYSPLVKVQTWSEVPSGTALFESLLVFENYPTEASLSQHCQSLEVGDVQLFESTNYPLTILVAANQELLLRIIYDPSRFDSGTISRMLGHYGRLLEGMAASPEQTLSALSLLTEEESRQILYEWNDTKVQNTAEELVHQLFEGQVERHDGVAAIFGDEKIRYSELNKRANQLAHYLLRLGVRPDDLVGLLMERSLEMVISVLGILKAGAAYLPLDPTYPSQRLSFMLQDAKASLVLTQQRLAEVLPEQGAQFVRIDADWKDISTESAENPHSDALADHLAYVIYTSGSTGRPKGVAMTHRALSNLLGWELRKSSLKCGTRTLQFSSLSFDVSFQEIFSTLCAGGTLLLISEELQRDVYSLWQFISTEAIERLFVPSVMLQQLAQVAGQVETWPTSLRQVITAGEQLQITPQISKLFYRLENCTLENQYGPTESHVATSFPLSGPVNTWSNLPPIGRPIANTQVYLFDKQLQPVPIGVPGELYLGGTCLARGYIHHPELTNERFIQNPLFGDRQERLYRTGDIARYLPDGNLEFLGRVDEQVKVRGYRIELGEIEAVLARHPAVQECAVAVPADDDGQKRIVAYIVTEEGISFDDLRKFLGETLPEYMIPSAFIKLDDLPLTASGKVDRRSLSLIQGESLESDLVNYVPPRNPIEEMVAEIWAAVLHKPQVGVQDNFFELGGHSLLATQLLSRLRDAFQIELPLRSLFDAPTVTGIASKIAETRLIDRHLSQTPLVRIARDADLPLSFAQERMWFFDQLAPGTSDYNVPLAIRVLGSLDVSVLERAISEIVRRHEVLRTTFTSNAGRPVQVIAEALPIKLPIIDLRHLPEIEREAAVQKLAIAEANQPFDLTTGPLVRVNVLQLGSEEHILLLTMHHIAFDGWSVGVLSREVSVLYAAFTMGQSSPLPDLPIQYADFAHWQRQLLQGEFAAEQLSYWKGQLEDAPAVLELPLDHPRSILLTAQGAAERFTLPEDLSQSLKVLGRREGVTLFMTLLATFKTLLYRYTGQAKITVGSPIANRNQLEVEGLIGCFINSLALRTDLEDSLTFQELLRRVREVTLGAYAHQDLPFEKLVEELQLERDLSRTPLFQVMLIFQNAPLSLPELPALIVQPEEIDTHKSVFDLTLTMWETGQEINGLIEYNAGLFEPATIQRLLGHYRTLLEGVVANPAQQLSDLPMLTEAERHQLLVTWNDTRTERPPAQCIHHLFEAQVERTPDATAMIFDDEKLTYRELNKRANQLAHYLRREGVGPEVLVGLLMERSLEMVIGMLGILKAGGAYVPLDRDYPEQPVAFMCDDAGLQLLVTKERWGQLVEKKNAQALSLDKLSELIAKESSANPVSGTTAENLAYVMYTSGSTGRPKGVMIQHSSLVNYCIAASTEYGLSEVDRVLQFATISFDTSVEEIFPCLTCGATLVLRDESMLDSTSVFLNQCQTKGITVLSLPTAYWHQLTEQLCAKDLSLLDSLRLLIIGGERARPESLKAWQQQVGHRVRLINTYGPTEATVVATTCDLSSLPATDERREVPIGRPISNVQVYVLDEHLNVVPIGVPGDLYIAGAGLARGYLSRPALTAERFIEASFDHTPCVRLYKTGDRARHLMDGNLEFLGRTDDQVKVRGYRIELGEVESVLAEHPAVNAGLVIAREDSSGEQSLIAYVVPGHEQPLAVSDLRNFLRERLPAYMVPSAFVTVDKLPLTPSGKVDRQALPSLELKRPELDGAFVAPRNAIEEKLAQIWAEVLGIEQVGVHDNFFDLGGHSLLATQLLFRLREALQVELPLHWLFEASTISELARKIAAHSSDPAPATDLQSEAVLDPAIEPRFGATTFVTDPANIFLTGATGFLGAFLLFELLQQTDAEIFCLVRAPDVEAGMKKLRENLESYSLWQESFGRRIVPVLGDLAQPLLGLSGQQFQRLAGEIDVIYHNGAVVNATYPYSALKSTNVLGTQEVLRLACQDKVKPLHFVSTLSVFAQDYLAQVKVVGEQDDLNLSASVAGGYAQSKWVAEKLVSIARSRGLPVCIYRPGRITGHSQTGISNTDNLMCKLIKISLQLRQVPDMDLLVDLTPVDYVGEAIVYLSRQKGSLGGLPKHAQRVSRFPNCLSAGRRCLAKRLLPIFCRERLPSSSIRPAAISYIVYSDPILTFYIQTAPRQTLQE